MKKIWILIFSVFLGISLFSQTKKDLLFLEKKLIKHDYLFHTLNKTFFKLLIQKHQLKKETLSRWEIEELLSNFKELNLKTIANYDKNRFIKIKVIHNKIYIFGIAKNYNFLLEEEILKINGTSIKTIKNSLRQKFYLPHQKSIAVFFETKLMDTKLLNYLNYIKNDSLEITTVNFEGKIPVITQNFEEIKIEKLLFKDRKKSVWFWSYGINFGQQLYLKFNQIISASHLKKIKDSLKWSNYKYAKTHHIPIQSTYNALKFIDLTNKLHVKFSNNRYKKLIIDFRDTKFGTTHNLDFFIAHLKKIKKLQKKKRIYILFNKYTNGASIKYIKSLQENFKPILIGETTYGTTSNTTEIEIIELPNSKIKISIPKKHQTEIEITPNIKVVQTLLQTKKGIDVALNRCLE